MISSEFLAYPACLPCPICKSINHREKEKERIQRRKRKKTWETPICTLQTLQNEVMLHLLSRNSQVFLAKNRRILPWESQNECWCGGRRYPHSWYIYTNICIHSHYHDPTNAKPPLVQNRYTSSSISLIGDHTSSKAYNTQDRRWHMGNQMMDDSQTVPSTCQT